MPVVASSGAKVNAAFKPCIIIPVYNHGQAIGAVLDGLRDLKVPCLLVDDGSDQECARVLDVLARRHADWLELSRLPHNQGKGAAMLHGFRLAARRGYSHALQVDADGQHDVAEAGPMLSQAAAAPDSVICGVPVYDASVPKGRLYGRYITHFWVFINTASRAIGDSMCGFRVYPLESTLRLIQCEAIGQRMDFDTDIIVRLYWRGVGMQNHTIQVRYPLDGVSHFAMWADNLRITRMHTRLFFTMLWRRFGLGPAIAPRSRRN